MKCRRGRVRMKLGDLVQLCCQGRSLKDGACLVAKTINSGRARFLGPLGKCPVKVV